MENELRIVAWEVTRNCNLNCVHCRASAGRGPYNDELSTEECLRLLNDISSWAHPLIIFTGGEPLLRGDIFHIAGYGKDKGLTMVMAVNGTLIKEQSAESMKNCGIKRVSISIDGATSRSHDSFRQVNGAFKSALKGIEVLKSRGLEFQLNTTVTKRNVDEISAILDLARQLGASAHHIFFLVPAGRGKELEEDEISSQKYEEVLNYLSQQNGKLPIKVTCAPHYYRILKQKRNNKEATDTKGGCLGGKSFCFISHTGQVQPCGYLEVSCGNIRERTLKTIWEESSVFSDLRALHKLKGKCGECEFKRICGGCRARAYAVTGDYLEEEPDCAYQPLTAKY